jgi:peptide/nickel transport system permease protein
MTVYIVRRLLHALVVLILVTIIVFFTMRLLPGDPILLLTTQESTQDMTEDQISNLRHESGLDKPLAVQYFNWTYNILHGELGRSIISKVSVGYELSNRIPVTLHLGILAFILGLLIGIPCGVICAIRRNTWLDTVITVLANIGVTMPVFWLGIMLMYMFGLNLKLLPIAGYTPPNENFLLNLRQIIMPVICLALSPIAMNVRQTRSCMLEVLNQDYIRTAWSKGLRERQVIIKHTLKNALIPVISLSGMGLSHILGGSVLIESVFVVPGMGLLIVSSITAHDYPFVQGVVLVLAIAVLLINLLVDLAYGWFDPRIRFG